MSASSKPTFRRPAPRPLPACPVGWEGVGTVDMNMLCFEELPAPTVVPPYRRYKEAEAAGRKHLSPTYFLWALLNTAQHHGVVLPERLRAEIAVALDDGYATGVIGRHGLDRLYMFTRMNKFHLVPSELPLTSFPLKPLLAVAVSRDWAFSSRH